MFDISHIQPDKGIKKNKMKGYIIKDGYKHIYKPSLKKGKKYKYVPLHRLLVEFHLKRKLKSTEIIHHKDKDKLNNDISNLEINTTGTHRGKHNILDKKNKLHFNKNKIKKLYLKGLSTREVAKKMKMGKSTVSEYIKKMKISRPRIQIGKNCNFLKKEVENND
jgi:IS30 family transposase